MAARRARGPGSRSRRGFVANTKAPKSSYAIQPGSGVGGKGRAKYPINTRRRAANALARVAQHGSATEKAKVYAAVAREYPTMAKTSSVPALRRRAKGGSTKRKRTTGGKRKRTSTGRRRR